MPLPDKSTNQPSCQSAALGRSEERNARWAIRLGGAVLVLATLAAYHNSWSAPFVLDDDGSIVANPTLRHLGAIRDVLSPPVAGGQTVGGRPVLNLSLALNYALSGTQVWSYHALNLAIHLAAGLTLFGIMRRTLARWSALTPTRSERLEGKPLHPSLLAFTVALLWTLHPLQTEAVTYIVQRAESLMGLFFLLTVYGFIRSLESPHAGRWQVLAVASCLLGMATKEVMVAAPLLVLLYDRTFAAGSFRQAWQRRRPLYLGLAATWFLLAYLVISTGGNRGGSVGFGVAVSWPAYVATQCGAILRYLGLAVWPHPLVFEYGARWVKDPGDVVPQALVVLALAAGTLAGLRRRSAAGFAGAWCFAILAPTSLMPGGVQMIVEHRMYLPLAAVIALAVLGLHAVAGRRCLAALLAAAVGLGWLTARRNADYGSALALWSDTVAKSPGSVVARSNLGATLFQLNRVPAAMREFEVALQINPAYPETHYNLGSAQLQLGHLAEAASQFREAVRLRPAYAKAHNNLGSALFQSGRVANAISEYEEALRLDPSDANAHYNLACAFLKLTRMPEAIEQFQAALQLNPADAKAHNNLGNALAEVHRPADAVAEYEAALRLKPDYALAHNNLGTVLGQLGRVPEAIRHHEAAVRLEPDSADLRYNLGNALLQAGRGPEAVSQYRAALRLRPDYAPAREALRRLQAPAESGSPGA